jgi:hypothetical protein
MQVGGTRCVIYTSMFGSLGVLILPMFFSAF